MIDGTYSIFYVKWEGSFLPVGCLTSESFEESSEMLDTTTRDNNGWKTSIPTSQSYNISIEGLLINTNFSGGDATKISLDRLTVLKRNRIPIEWQSRDNNSIYVRYGFGYITSLTKSTSTNEFINFTCNIKGINYGG